MNATLGGFFRGQLVVAVAVGLVSMFLFWVIGLPYYALLGAITGLFALVPLIGTVIAGGPLFAALIAAVVKYILTFVAIYIVALIVDALAPTFAGQKNFSNALKVTVYSYTPSWLAGVFLLIPGLRLLTILGLYGLYLLWLGLPSLMKSPEDKAIGYTAAVVICAIILALVIGAVLGVFIGVRGFM